MKEPAPEWKTVLSAINLDYLDDLSTVQKVDVIKRLGLVVSQEILEDDDLMTDLLQQVKEHYDVKPFVFEAIYENIPLAKDKSISSALLETLKSWYGELVCLVLEPDQANRFRLQNEREAMYQLLGLSPLQYNALPEIDIVNRFYHKFNAGGNFSKTSAAHEFIKELIKKRGIELRNPIPSEAFEIINQIASRPLDELSPKVLRDICKQIYDTKSKMLVSLAFDWEKVNVDRPKTNDCKQYIEAFIRVIQSFTSETQSIEDFVNSEIASLCCESDNSSFVIDESLIVEKTLHSSTKNGISITSIGIRYDKLYAKQNNKIVVCDDSSIAKPIDQLLSKNSSIKIQTRDVIATVNMSDYSVKYRKEAARIFKLRCLPTISYFSNEREENVPFFRLILYVSSTPDILRDVVSQLSNLDRMLMIVEEDLMVLLKEKIAIDSELDYLSIAKISYNIPSDVQAIFGFTPKSEQYFRNLINAKGSNSNQAKEIFIKLLTTPKTVAFLTKHEIEILGTLISTTKHVFKDMSVESGNLENVVGVINKMKQQASTNFLLMRIVGILSPTEVNRLLHSAYDGNSKLLFVASPYLITAAQVSGRYGDIIISDSISTENNVDAISFLKNSSISKLLELSESRELSYYNDMIFEYLNLMHNRNEERTKWRDYEKHWRENRRENEILILVSRHSNYYIVKHFKELGAYIVDPMQSNIHESVTDFVQASGNSSHNIFVVLDSHKISDVDKKTILRNLHRSSQMSSVVFVTEYFQPTDEIITIDSIGKTGSFCSTVIECAPREFHFTNPFIAKFYRFIYLMMPLSVSKNILAKLYQVRDDNLLNVIRKVMKDLADCSIGNLDSEGSELFRRNIETFERELASYINGGDIMNSEKLVVSKIAIGRDQSHEKKSLFSQCWEISDYEVATDIPFDQFVSEIPFCQFLPQQVRVKLWVKYVLGNELHQLTTNLQTNFLLASVVPSDYTVNIENSSHCYLMTKPDNQMPFDRLSFLKLLKKEDLDWNNSIGLESLLDSETHLWKILECYPYLLKLLFCLPVSSVYNLLSEALINGCNFKNLSKQMSHFDFLVGNNKLLREHRAVIHWILALASNELNILTPDDVAIMIEMKLKLSNVKVLQKQVMPVVLSLDGNSGFLSSDLDIKHILLTESILSYLSTMEEMKLGSEAIHFIFNPSNWNNFESTNGDCLLSQPIAHNLYTFIKNPSTHYLDANKEKEWRVLVTKEDTTNLEKALTHLTNSAIVSLIQKCSKKYQLYILAYILRDHKDLQNIVQATCETQGFELKYFFLDSILLLCDHIDRDQIQKNVGDPVCQQIVNPDAFVVSHIQKLFLEYSESISRSKHLQLFCSRFELEYQQTTNQRIKGSRSLYLVTWILGAPQTNITVGYEDYEILKSIFDIDSVQNSFVHSYNQASDLITFFLFPSYLSESSYNFYAELFKLPIIESLFKTICQLDIADFPPYSCEFVRRRLPNTYVQHLANELAKWRPTDTKKEFREIAIDTDGISLEKVKMNLQALYDARFNIKTAHQPTSAFIVNYLLSFFYCAGITPALVYEWLKVPFEKPRDLEENDFKKVTLYPFPSFMSTQIIHESKNILFGTSKDDVIFTIRRFNKLVPDALQKDPAYYLSEKCDRFGRSIFIPSPNYQNFAEPFVVELSKRTKLTLQHVIETTLFLLQTCHQLYVKIAPSTVETIHSAITRNTQIENNFNTSNWELCDRSRTGSDFAFKFCLQYKFSHSIP